MKLAAIVCEYNPFHKGHQYHIEQTKKKTNCDGIVAVMSGNFVQRGEGAIFSKELRAKAATLGGADLVLELSPSFAMQSAEAFSTSALKIITSIPEVSFLSFGAEKEDIEILKRVAKILVNEPENYKAALKMGLDKGISYPAAREEALIKIGENDGAKVLGSPNNILGVEYLKAIERLGSSITPVLIKRVGAEHDSLMDGDFVSASRLREKFYTGDKKSFKMGIFGGAMDLFEGGPALNKNDFETMILSRIITMSPEELREISEVAEGLENRIKKAAQEAKSLAELAEAVKSKRYTLSKIRRILINAGLGIKQDRLYTLPPYAKILDFNENGQKILNKIKKTSQIPIIKNMTALKRIGDKNLISQYERETEFDRLYRLYTEDKNEG